MKESPIIYSTEMVLAQLDNRKSVTRRMDGLKKINESPENYAYKGIHPDNPSIHIFARLFRGEWVETLHIKCPYGQPGDVLWVRESYVEGCFDDGKHGYKADWNSIAAEYVTKPKWKPSIHMPKAAARIWNRNLEVYPERLWDINEDDAIAEGIERDREGWKSYDIIEKGLHKGESHPWNAVPYKNAKFSFESLWKSIYGSESYSKNPWVWRIKYEEVSRTGKENIKF